VGRDDGHVRAGVDQGAEFSRGDLTATDDQHATSGELEENRKQGHSNSVQIHQPKNEKSPAGRGAYRAWVLALLAAN
jgi:hypothetical protein